MPKDEFEFINKIKPSKVHQFSLQRGIGDDAAVFSPSSMFDELICMDTMVEGIHFTKTTMTPFMIGYKALAVNISDIAAMGGIPTYYLVSIAIPSDWDELALEEIYKGMSHLGNQFSMDLIGGDTVSSKHGLIITVTVCGKIEKGLSLYRSNAKQGDYVFVVGEVGASAAGLDLLLEHGLDYRFSEAEKKLLQEHQYPFPQVQAGRLLATSGERISLNDISDGLASETNELAEASNVSLEINFEKIPMSTFIKSFSPDKKKKWCLYGGEDYKLVGTMPRQAFKKIKQTFIQNKLLITIIGEVTGEASGVYITEDGRREQLRKKGFNHFK